MFLADSLRQKIRTSIEKYGFNQEDDCLFPYKKPKQKPILLAGLKNNSPEFTHEQLKEMTKEDYLNKFTIKRLQNKWSRKFKLNYDISNSKFTDDYKFLGAKEAKKYIKDLLDRDIFGKKNPKWNNSTKPDDVIKSKKLILKKVLYEANHGYINYKNYKKKKSLQRANSVGVHSFNSYWNVSIKLEEKEKNELNKELLEKSFNNTQKYWLKNNYRRKNELEYPLSSERKQLEKPKYFKIYKNPKNLVEYNYEVMQKAKNDLWLEKEKVLKEVKEKNPTYVKEKIDYLVNKKMEQKYKERFYNIKNKKNLNITENKKTSNLWKDKELIDKIKLIEQWKNIKDIPCPILDKTFNPEEQKRLLFKDLVRNKEKIIKEQKKIKDEIQKENYIKIKLEELQSKKNGKNKISPLQYSKYPINREIYEYNQKINNNKDNPQIIVIDNKDYSKNSNVNNIYNENGEDDLSKTKYENDEKKLFLEAYKRIMLQNDNKKKFKNRPISCKITKRNKYNIIYIHPGIYRQFNYIVNFGKNKVKEEKFMAWSCCNNKDKKSKGCQKTFFQKEKNFGFP